jgi:parallel beta-helix repeat protein
MRSDHGSHPIGPPAGQWPVRPSRAARGTRGRRRRSRALTIAGVVLALVGALVFSVRALTPAASDLAGHPVLLGAYADGGEATAASQQAATRRLEAAIGRKLAIGHSLVPWGAGLGSLPAWNVAEGRRPMISFGDGASPRAVAAGRYDTYLTSLARSVAALGRPVLLRYASDMDRSGSAGSAQSGTSFVAAWRHVHDLFGAQALSASWVWSPTADAFASGRAARYWPGDGYVDWIAADGFNMDGCDGRVAGWRDFGRIFRAFSTWGSARGKPLMVAGTGTVEDPGNPARKAGWYLGAAATLAQSMPGVRAVVIVDRPGRCDWRPDTSAASLQGFVRFATDPVFGGVQAGPTSTSATTTTTRSTTTTTVHTTTTTSPPAAAPTTTQPVASCASGGVAISTGDNAQQVVDAHGAGTTYVVKAGTHLRNFSVRPKSGDRFCGEPGAVLDGGRSLQRAFAGSATAVTLDSITVRDYAPGWQGAAIQPDRHANGWLLRNVSSLHNGWGGLLLADGMRILGGHFNDNDQEGIGGNEATGMVLDGLDGDPATFDGPELARNHHLHASCDWGSAGMKWDFGQITIRNAYVHDNDCKGLWADINVHDALIERNLIEDNGHEGIYYEISRGAVIRNNRVYGNGLGGNGWYWAGGITAASSSDVEVYGNRLSGNFNGITGTQQDRPDSTPPEHLLDQYRVHDNLICATTSLHPTGAVADNDANLSARDITFTGNTIQSTGCE